jgi:hypothetical protein
MINMLDHYGLSYRRLDGIVSLNQDYDIIANAHRQALDSSKTEHVLILEDDCIPYKYREQFEVPDNADIIYLGLHVYGHPKEKISKDICRVSGMAGAHAILYLTQRGKDILVEAQKLTKDKKLGFDIALSKLQYKVNTYALNIPIWYQKDAPELTKFDTDNLNILPGYYGGGHPDYDKPIKY